MRWQPIHYQKLDREAAQKRFQLALADALGWIFIPFLDWIERTQATSRQQQVSVRVHQWTPPGGPVDVRVLPMTDNQRWAMCQAEQARVARINSLTYDRSSCPLP